MKKLTLALLSAIALALPARAAYYVAGDFNGWNPAGNLMNDMGGGIWQATLSGVGGRHEYKVTIGDWSQNWPGANSWFYGDGGGNITLTFDVNTYADGWQGAWGRMGVSAAPVAWTAAGDWQGWNNAKPETAMTAQGGGLYKLSYVIGSPGGYQYKAVNTSSWDAIGSDFRSINAGNLSFTTTDPNQTVEFWANALNGTIKANVIPIPEPTAFALLGAGLACLLGLRRRQ